MPMPKKQKVKRPKRVLKPDKSGAAPTRPRILKNKAIKKKGV